MQQKINATISTLIFHQPVYWAGGKPILVETNKPVPNYLGNASLALDVAKKMVAQGFHFALKYNRGYLASFVSESGAGVGTDLTASAAICFGALKAARLVK